MWKKLVALILILLLVGLAYALASREASLDNLLDSTKVDDQSAVALFLSEETGSKYLSIVDSKGYPIKQLTNPAEFNVATYRLSPDRAQLAFQTEDFKLYRLIIATSSIIKLAELTEPAKFSFSEAGTVALTTTTGLYAVEPELKQIASLDNDSTNIPEPVWFDDHSVLLRLIKSAGGKNFVTTVKVDTTTGEQATISKAPLNTF